MRKKKLKNIPSFKEASSMRHHVEKGDTLHHKVTRKLQNSSKPALDGGPRAACGA